MWLKSNLLNLLIASVMPGLAFFRCGLFLQGFCLWFVSLCTASLFLWGYCCFGWSALLFVWFAARLLIAADGFSFLKRKALSVFGVLNCGMLFLLLWLVPLWVEYALVTRTVVGEYQVDSDTMFPQQIKGDSVIYKREKSLCSKIHAGDLLVLDWPESGPEAARVVAIGPARVHVQSQGIWVDGQIIQQKIADLLFDERLKAAWPSNQPLHGVLEQNQERAYLTVYESQPVENKEISSVLLQKNELFVMGDARSVSVQSGHFGRMSCARVLGRPFLIRHSRDARGHLRPGRSGLKTW